MEVRMRYPTRVLAVLVVVSLWPGAGSARAEEPVCTGVELVPGQSIQAAIDSNPTGTTFCLTAGVHRVAAALRPRASQQFVGAAGAVLNGSRPVELWAPSGSRWVSTGHTQGPTVNYGGSFPSFLHPESQYSDDLYYDGRLLKRVADAAAVVPGTFFFDYAADTVWIGDDPAGHLLELATAEAIFGGGGTGVTIKNLIVEKAAGRGIDSANGWQVLDNEIRLNATIGLKLYSNTLARGNRVHHNGQYGIGGSGDFLVVEDNEIAYNNSHLYYVENGGNWGSGGSKFTRTGDPTLGQASGLVLKGNRAHHNWGDGLWVDIDNIHGLIEGNRSYENERFGINFEIGYASTIRGNFVERNGADGIRISSSPDLVVEGNTVDANGGGIVLWQQGTRTAGSYGEYVVKNTLVRNNRVGMTSGRHGAGFWGTPPAGYSIYSAGNRFEGNSYWLASTSKYFWWESAYRTTTEWKSYGHDAAGSFQTGTMPTESDPDLAPSPIVSEETDPAPTTSPSPSPSPSPTPVAQKPRLKSTIRPYGTFSGGTRVASGNLDSDSSPEIVTGTGRGGGPHVRTFELNGTPRASFFAYGSSFRGGVDVAVGDVDGDGRDEIITSPGAGGGPHIRIFRADGRAIGGFMAYSPSFRGGVNVTTADVNGDGRDEIITGPGRGGGPHVRIFRASG